jgi:predicted MFS family arabinose efflux permease
MKVYLATHDWRVPFIVFTFGGLAIAAVIRFGVPRWFSDSKGPDEVSGLNAVVHAHVPDHLWNRNVILGAVASAVLGVSLFGFISLYSTFAIKVLHFAPMSAALGLSFYGLGGLTSFVGGWLGVRFNQRWVGAVAFVSLAVNAYLMYNVVTSVHFQCLLSFLLGVFGTGFLASGLPSLLQRCVRPEMVGRASGVFVTFVFGGGIFAGWVLAWLVEKIGWGMAGFVELTLVPMIGLVAMILIKEEQLMVRTK